jgi:hypothetical protein
MRSQTGAPKTDGPDADSIIAQGGGLIDVFHAVNAKALMGVEGDGIDKPSILGSYSYGEVPVANNRISYTAPINVTIRDLSGEGGTYNLNVANNRDLQLTGINVSTSQSSVNVPANGSATFTVRATFNGDQIRDVMAAKTVGTSVIFERSRCSGSLPPCATTARNLCACRFSSDRVRVFRPKQLFRR